MAGIGETIRENAGALLATLQKDPLTTPVGQKIEQATDPSLASENWGLNMEICDMITDTDDGPKDAGKAIRKRLMTNAGRNYTVVMYTLIVLETCVKNCGRRFHLVVSQKDFVQELVRLIGPKNDPPTAVQEKVLSLIQNWAIAFRSNPDMQGVVQIYADLKSKGLEFPVADTETMVPIHTPQRSVPTPESRPPSASIRMGSAMQGDLVPSVPVMMTPDMTQKLKSELEIVQRNMQVFSEMLNELEPGFEHPRDWELLQELLKACHAMQTRIVELVEKVANEQITSELLRLNDELNNLFVRYERFEKRRTAIVSHNRAASAKTQAGTATLIDFGAEEAVAGVKKLTLTDNATKPKATGAAMNTPENDEFEAFAQSRNAKDQNAADAPIAAAGSAAAVSSSEFDKFLQERAAAADRLPSIEAQTGTKGKKEESNLLAL